jgi:hypothetical protein
MSVVAVMMTKTINNDDNVNVGNDQHHMVQEDCNSDHNDEFNNTNKQTNKHKEKLKRGQGKSKT